jgi:hypothetical protein
MPSMTKKKPQEDILIVCAHEVDKCICKITDLLGYQNEVLNPE